VSAGKTRGRRKKYASAKARKHDERDGCAKRDAVLLFMVVLSLSEFDLKNFMTHMIMIRRRSEQAFSVKKERKKRRWWEN
jgi:hypothetical protein